MRELSDVQWSSDCQAFAAQTEYRRVVLADMWLLPQLARAIFAGIGASMWLWMQGYINLQELTFGEEVFYVKARKEPAALRDGTLGEHKFVKLTNITMHYVTKGCEDDRRTMLLMLHSFLDFWFIWNRQIRDLSKDFCIVAPDIRGHGKTSKPRDSSQYLMKFLVEDVKDLIKRLNGNKKRQVVLVGHGWGAMISFCFVTKYEHLNLVKKMIVINGCHPRAFRKQLVRSLSQMLMAWYMIAFRKPVVPEQYIRLRDMEFFDDIHGRAFTREEENATKYEFAKKGALTAALNHFRAFNNDSDHVLRFRRRNINIPTLILWGEEDLFITTKVARYNQRWLTNSAAVYYPRAGHWLQRECPVQVNARIRDFAKNDGFSFKPRQQSDNINCSEFEVASIGKREFKGLPGVPPNTSAIPFRE